jgi:hypothetical protein
MDGRFGGFRCVLRMHHFETIESAISKLLVHHQSEFGREAQPKNRDKSATKLVNGPALAFV